MSWLALLGSLFLCIVFIIGMVFGIVVIGLALIFFVGEIVEKATDRACKAVKRRKKEE